MIDLMRIFVTFEIAVRRFYRISLVNLTLEQAVTDKVAYEHGVIQGDSLSVLLQILSVNSLPFGLD